MKKRTVYVLLAVTILFVTGLYLMDSGFLSTKPNGLKKVASFSREPYLSEGEELVLHEGPFYTIAGPDPMHFWSDITVEDLLLAIEKDNESAEIVYLGDGINGAKQYAISLHHQDAKIYYGLISYGEEKIKIGKLNRKRNGYALIDFGTTVFYENSTERAQILFPSALISDDDLCFLQLTSGQKFPLVDVGQGSIENKAVLGFLETFYNESLWYKCRQIEENKLEVEFDGSKNYDYLAEQGPEELYTGKFMIQVTSAAIAVELIA